MVDLLARNWVLVLVLGGMAFMHFGMHRGHGKSGHGGGCGGGRAQDGHEPEAPTLHASDTTRRSQGSHAEGTEAPSGESAGQSGTLGRQRPSRGCATRNAPSPGLLLTVQLHQDNTPSGYIRPRFRTNCRRRSSNCSAPVRLGTTGCVSWPNGSPGRDRHRRPASRARIAEQTVLKNR